MPARVTSPAVPYLVVGGLCGLIWAASLRGWMSQLVPGESAFTWLTFALLLLPGVVVGVLLGRAAYLRSTGGRPDRRLVFAPVLFLTALLDPVIFEALIRTGQGGGAIWVVMTALAAGFALARPRWSPDRVLTTALAVLGLLGIAGIGTMSGPWSSARGAWVSVYGLILVILLCLASALPYPAVRGALRAPAYVAVGSAVGLAWACALRAFMAQVAGAESTVDWTGTFGLVLLPGAVIGGLLGWAEYARRSGGRPGGWWLALSPFLFAVVLLPGVVEDPARHLFTGGIGAGALAVPLLGIIGGYALSGRGPVWTRIVAGVSRPGRDDGLAAHRHACQWGIVRDDQRPRHLGRCPVRQPARHARARGVHPAAGAAGPRRSLRRRSSLRDLRRPGPKLTGEQDRLPAWRGGQLQNRNMASDVPLLGSGWRCCVSRHRRLVPQDIGLSAPNST